MSNNYTQLSNFWTGSEKSILFTALINNIICILAHYLKF